MNATLFVWAYLGMKLGFIKSILIETRNSLLQMAKE